jgi:RNA-directed DNA polymerase
MARTNRDRAFSSLQHVIDMEWMQEAYRQTRKDGVAGSRLGFQPSRTKWRSERSLLLDPIYD